MSKHLALSALTLATLALNACSSEPSDWRPDKKVSVDMVAPGSRSSDNFDQNTAAAADQSKGGAIARPLNSGVTLDEPNQRKRTTAEEARTAGDNTPDAGRNQTETTNPSAPSSTKPADTQKH